MTRRLTAASVCALAAFVLPPPSLGQAPTGYQAPASSAPTVITTSDGKKIIQATPGNPFGKPGQPVPGQPPGARPGMPPGAPGKPGATPPGKPGATPPGKPGEKGAEPGKGGTVKRPDKPATPPNPEELKVRPDEAGMVRFQFRGQSWPDVLEWLAEISGMSVDWQELPGDFVNISTQRPYKIEEIRNLFNRLLLARGFTMLPQGEFIIVVKCDQLSVGLVPRVVAGDLETLPPHDYVRVMFSLDYILADDVAKELEPLISTNGKLFPLKNTNRVEAMDAVINLREIHRLLTEEQQTGEGGSRLVHEFVLRYARAEEVREKLMEFVGGSSGMPRSTRSMTPQQLAAQQQAMMRMQQQMAQQSRSSSSRSKTTVPKMPSKEKPVRIMVNQRRNSLLVQAPPDKLAVISDAIMLLDVRDDSARSLQGFLGRMQVYRLTQLDPEKLVKSLQELGGLDPSTRLEVDETNRAIIAYASVADHYTINSTIEKLDGSARRVEVIPLRRLAADEVAGTIQFLMAGSGEEKSSRSSYRDYYPYGYSSRSSRNQEPKDEFRVDADVANNRLLVRANDMELEEVVSILTKLGEIPQADQVGSLTRVLDIAPGEDTAEFLEKLQKNWKALSPNPLVLPEIETPAKKETPTTETPADASPARPETEPTTAAISGNLFHTALYQQPADEAVSADSQGDVAQPKDEAASETALPGRTEDSPPAGTIAAPTPEIPPGLRARPPTATPAQGGPPAPIVVSIAPDGRLVLASRDPQAMAMLEELVAKIAPRTKDYAIFRLKSAPATWVVLNLEDFFEDEEGADNKRRDRMYSMIFGMPSSSSEDERRLSKRRPLKFITDMDTNTILVQGADPEQLKTIEELIELYDVPEPVSSQNARVTKLIFVQYSQASIVAETIKDAYRDLLSSNDKSLQNGGKGKQQQQSRSGGMTVISAFGLGEQPPSDSRTSARFEGKLSIGIDDVTNTLLVSTEGENLMQVVEGMIKALDEAAKPVSAVRVVTLVGTDGSRLQKALDTILSNKGQKSPAAVKPTGQPKPGSPPRPGAGMPRPVASPSRR